MADELVNMSQQFSGLPMSALIGAPLAAACESQLSLAKATADFIKTVGFEEDGQKLRTARFAFKQLIAKEDGSQASEDMYIDAPMLSIINIPNLSVKTVDISFDMEVKSSFEDKSSQKLDASAEASINWGGI